MLALATRGTLVLRRGKVRSQCQPDGGASVPAQDDRVLVKGLLGPGIYRLRINKWEGQTCDS